MFFYITVFPSIIIIPITILGQDFFNSIGWEDCVEYGYDNKEFCYKVLGDRLQLFSFLYMIFSYPLFLIYRIFTWSIR